jgi:hypothetical protein
MLAPQSTRAGRATVHAASPSLPLPVWLEVRVLPGPPRTLISGVSLRILAVTRSEAILHITGALVTNSFMHLQRPRNRIGEVQRLLDGKHFSVVAVIMPLARVLYKRSLRWRA